MSYQQKELNAEGYLENFVKNPSVQNYVVFNQDGIVMRYGGRNMNQKKAIHYANVLLDYQWAVKKQMNGNLRLILNQDGINNSEIEYIRFRTKNNKELIFTHFNEFFMVCTQVFGE